MSKFTFSPCKNKTGITIPNLYIITPNVFVDNRGYFMETCNPDFDPYLKHLDGSPATFVQDNESKSKKGVLRGLHFQKTEPQGKCVRMIDGEIFDVAVDLRRNSPTFGSWYGVMLSSENKLQFYVPEGFAHGFLVLSSTATFVYKCTRLYNSADEGGIMWDSCQIDWPIVDGVVLLSEKDKKNPTYDELIESGFGF